MKKLTLLIILFCAYISYAQVQGCQWSSSLAATDSNYHTCRAANQFAILTITLGNANDTVLVKVGTNFADSTQTTQHYGITSITDMYADDGVTVITGNTTTNRKYFIKWGYRQKNILLESTTNAGAVAYTLEFY